MKEQLILSAILKDRGAYETFKRVGNSAEFGPIGELVCRHVAEYYDADNGATSCSRDLIRDRLSRVLQGSKQERAVIAYLTELPEDVSAVNVELELREVHRARLGQKLSLALANGAKQEEIDKLIEAYAQAGQDTSLAQVGSPDWEAIDGLDTTHATEEPEESEGFLKLYPKALNEAVNGRVRRGHHLLVFARPDTGKTTFVVNLVCGFLAKGLRVLYCANEEPIQDIRDRVQSRLLRVDRASLREVLVGRPQAALARGVIQIVRCADFKSLRKALEHSDYDVLVIDQIRNMRTKADNRVGELEVAGIAARAIAGDYAVLCVSVTQAADSASGRAYLDMSDVDSSKTGLPGAVDAMIGLGADDAMRVNGLMGVSLCKSKFGPHSKFTCTINFSTGVIS